MGGGKLNFFLGDAFVVRGEKANGRFEEGC